ncbi:VWA domain-containing protein [Nocardia sp. NPDC059240]|uniref:vWA domain-containing protein n=1 Tax=Nocardia sp. NPDC059240 TaxID=3346786 RepID=UPI00369124E2
MPEALQFANIERPPVFPVCLVVDVSGSMSGRPIDAVNQALPEMQRAILDDPSTGEIARISVVTFETHAQIALPLSDMHETQLPMLATAGLTNFHDAFTKAREAIENGIRGLGKGTRFYRPVVFFLSDGGNTGPDWQPAWHQLTRRDDKYGAEVVSFGMGQADREAIGRVSTGHAFFATDTDPANAVREIIKTVVNSIRSTSRSFNSANPGLSIAPTAGLTPLPVQVVG